MGKLLPSMFDVSKIACNWLLIRESFFYQLMCIQVQRVHGNDFMIRLVMNFEGIFVKRLLTSNDAMTQPGRSVFHKTEPVSDCC